MQDSFIPLAHRRGTIVKGFLILAVVGIIFSSVLAVSTSVPATDLGSGDEPILLVQDTPSPPPRLSTGTVSGVTNTSWTTVQLGHDYAAMVVVASPNYDDTAPPLVTRLRNAQGDSFELRVDRADGSTAPVSGVTVHYLAVERGVYTLASDGVKLEAVRFTSTVTDHAASWVGQARSYSNSYTNPVVVGQVMTYNDPDFSVFWSRGSAPNQPPTSASFYAGKQVGEDADTTRSFETIGFLVLEAGTGSIEGVGYLAQLGADSVAGVADAPPYTYALSGLDTAAQALVSSAGMDDTDGGWPLLYGPDPLSSTSLNLAVDEDQLADPERGHGTEQVALLVFE